MQVIAGLEQNSFIIRTKTEFAGSVRIVFATYSTTWENAKKDSK